MVKRQVKAVVRKTYHVTKRVVASNSRTKQFARKAKKVLLGALSVGENREIYNVSTFYPTIQDYYAQMHDSRHDDPLISILLPTYNTPEDYLRECIESILVQSYQKWELCIADDKSSDPNVVKVIEEYMAKDERIKLVKRKSNGHISLASNSALKIAQGDFIALMDHDDVLWPNALYEMVYTIRNNPDADLIYSDEDKIDSTGRVHSYPFLKPDFSPEFLESCNYITHFSCIRTDLIRSMEGFRKGLEGAQDWDLFIRIGEVTNNIVHIPKMLYSWRIHEASTASDTDAKPYVYEAQKRLLEDHIARQGKAGDVVTGIIKQHRTIKYYPVHGSLLTVILDIQNAEEANSTLRSLSEKSAGAAYEVIIAGQYVFKANEGIFPSDVAVKYAANLDDAVQQASGTSIAFIKDVLSLNTGDWARLLLADTQIKGVGIVYPVVLAEDRVTIVSAGVGIGYGNGALNMLEGMPLQDDHYTRGLYAKSRRNVTSGLPVLCAVSAEVLKEFPKLSSDSLEESITLINRGYRNIYTPYVQVTYSKKQTIDGFQGNRDYVDQFLNPNFDKSNGRMEVNP